MRKIAPMLLTLALLATAGCVHRISVQQGNYLDYEAVDRVEQGMTREQVRLLLGTPVADDPFSNERWDYVYYFRNGRTGQVTQRQVQVYFEGNSVSRVERKDG